MEAFQRINLHWHDLRHEYASRLVERGVPLSQVRDLLGHASIATTERYDNQRLEALQAAAGSLESGKRFNRSRPTSRTKFQESFKITGRGGSSDPTLEPTDAEANVKKDNDLDEWLAIRDEFRNWAITAA